MCCAHVVEKSLLHQNVKGFYSKMHHYLVISFQIEDFAWSAITTLTAPAWHSSYVSLESEARRQDTLTPVMNGPIKLHLNRSI